MEQIWHYILNQFLNATKTSFKKAVKLSNYHDAALAEAQTHEPLLIPIYTRYHPLHQNLVQKYNEWRAAGGTQKGKTASINQLLELSIPMITNWDARVQTVYAKGSPRYIEIFPNGHSPFVADTIDNRINAFDSLSRAIGADANPVIMAVKAEVDAEFILLDGAHDTQIGAKGVKKADSNFVDAARVETLTMQYRDLGFCMDNFTTNLVAITDALFDQQTLREHQQTHFTGTVQKDETKEVLIHTFLDDDELVLEVTGEGAPGSENLTFYLGSAKSATNSSPVQVGINNGKLTITASQFNPGNWGTHRFLTAVNSSGVELQYSVDI